jgi:hypothetical protein
MILIFEMALFLVSGAITSANSNTLRLHLENHHKDRLQLISKMVVVVAADDAGVG